MSNLRKEVRENCFSTDVFSFLTPLSFVESGESPKEHLETTSK